MKTFKYSCPKCQFNQYEIGHLKTRGTVLCRILNISRNCFTTVTCKRCAFTEIYKTMPKNIETILEKYSA